MTFFFYDYEAFGRYPLRDRPVAFAGVRTDEEFNYVEDPVVQYCKIAPDYLPDPGAVLVHGISPMRSLEVGVSEAEFARVVHAELSRPGTCSLAYNGYRYDHRMSQHLFWRTLRCPYGWSWRAGCSTFDIIETLRAAFALCPSGIEWPRRSDGGPSFRLGDLAMANGIELSSAHDALQDAMATVELTRLLRSAQPALFNYALGLRSKRKVKAMLDGPVVWTSSFLSGDYRCATLVAPICECPGNSNAIIVFDLRQDPSPFLRLTAEELRMRLFTPQQELPLHVHRPAIHKIRLNACPFIAQRSILTDDVAASIAIDLAECGRHYEILSLNPDFAATVTAAFTRGHAVRSQDVDTAVYDSFIPDADRARLDHALQTDPSLSMVHDVRFQDDRLPELVFRYRARSFWHDLNEGEQHRWQAHCRSRHLSCDHEGTTPLSQYFSTLEELRISCADDLNAVQILEECTEFGRQIWRWID